MFLFSFVFNVSIKKQKGWEKVREKWQKQLEFTALGIMTSVLVWDMVYYICGHSWTHTAKDNLELLPPASILLNPQCWDYRWLQVCATMPGFMRCWRSNPGWMNSREAFYSELHPHKFQTLWKYYHLLLTSDLISKFLALGVRVCPVKFTAHLFLSLWAVVCISRLPFCFSC